MVEYTYDYLDRRMCRSYEGTNPDTFAYQVHRGDELVLEFTDDDGLEGETYDTQLAHRYLYGPAVDQILAVENGSGDVLWGLADHQGTIRDVVKHDSSLQPPHTVLVNHVQYDAFGRITSGEAAADFLFAFTGRPIDPDTDLYDYRARWYDPEVGRFLTEDPAGLDADVNLYRYAGNSPVVYIDPFGLCYSGSAYAIGVVSDPPRFCGACHDTGFAQGWTRFEDLSWGDQITVLGALHARPPELPEAVLARISGGSRLLVGGTTGVASVGACSTGLGSIVGVPGAAWSGDQLGTGLLELWTGKFHDSLGAAAIKSVAGDGLAGNLGAITYDVAPAFLFGNPQGTIRATTRVLPLSTNTKAAVILSQELSAARLAPVTQAEVLAIFSQEQRAIAAGLTARAGAAISPLPANASRAIIAPSNAQFTFRGDTRPPSQIFQEGLAPRGTSTNLLDYAKNNSASTFVGTSRSGYVAEGIVGEGGYVYTTRVNAGIDVNATLGKATPFPYEMEIAVPGGIKPQDIHGAWQVTNGQKTLYVPNPRFKQ